MEHINSKRILRDQVCINIGWNHYLSLVQQQDDWDGATEIALVYAEAWRCPSERTSVLVPLNQWLISFNCDDDKVAVDVEDYSAFGFTTEAELVAHVMSEAVRYVKFINFV